MDTVKTTLGPRGMDKLIVANGKVTISNDGATVMKLLDIVHPAAKTLVEIAKSQDEEGNFRLIQFESNLVGDGTTSVVVLAGEFLKQAKSFVEEGVHPQSIIKGFRRASELVISYLDLLNFQAKEKYRKLAVNVDEKNPGFIYY